jgi:hypothetical protein
MFRSRDQGKRDAALAKYRAEYTGKKDPASLTWEDMPRNRKPTADCWDSYKDGPAPTICMEGADNLSGSHGALHAATEAAISKERHSTSMPYPAARDRMATIVSKTYGCDASCLKKQLDEAYCKMYTCEPQKSCDDKLKNAKVTPHAGTPGGGPDVEHEGI